MEMFHGAHTAFALHVGQCFTPDEGSAVRYAAKLGQLARIEVELDGLRVLEVEGYDMDSDLAPGDDGNGLGADVLVFDDMDEAGRSHTTYRLMTQAAVDVVTSVRVVSALGLMLREERGYGVW